MIVNKGNKRYKHLTQDDRNILEIMLQNATTFQTIAAALGKDACRSHAKSVNIEPL